MIAMIVVASTVKGVLTGLAAGLIARRWHSVIGGVIAGLAIGGVLSTLAALGQPDHYWEIVLPGMLVGSIAGFVTQRYPRRGSRDGQVAVLVVVLMGALSSAASTTAAAQSAPAASPLSPLDGFIGRWAGTSEGQPGSGSSEREYSRLFGSRFVQARNRTVYKPQEKNPKGETHEDIGFFSFDRARKRIVLRQLHSEGFVNHYVADSSEPSGPLVFTTETIENIPPGWRARESYRFLGPDELEEVFELAAPGKEFELYSRSRLKRLK